MTEAKKQTVLIVKMDPELKKKFAMVALQRGTSMSGLVRRYVEVFLEVDEANREIYPFTGEA